MNKANLTAKQIEDIQIVVANVLSAEEKIPIDRSKYVDYFFEHMEEVLKIAEEMFGNTDFCNRGLEEALVRVKKLFGSKGEINFPISGIAPDIENF